DQRDRSSRFVAKREGVFARPHPSAPVAVVLRRLNLVLAGQLFRECAPLVRTCTRAMQGYHPFSACWPRRVQHLIVHGSVLSGLAVSPITARGIPEVRPMSLSVRSLIDKSSVIAACSMRQVR